MKERGKNEYLQMLIPTTHSSYLSPSFIYNLYHITEPKRNLGYLQFLNLFKPQDLYIVVVLDKVVN